MAISRQHGITVETVKNVVIDSGAVVLDYGLGTEVNLGATRGNNTFVVEQDIKLIEVDGARGPMKGHRRIINVRAMITANFIQLSTDILKKALPGSVSVSLPAPGATKTHDSITRALDIESGLAGEAGDDYLTNVAIVGEVSGTSNPVVCILSNVIADGNLEMNFVEKDEMVLSVQFTAHFSPSTPDTEPWNIRYPKVNIES